MYNTHVPVHNVPTVAHPGKMTQVNILEATPSDTKPLYISPQTRTKESSTKGLC